MLKANILSKKYAIPTKQAKIVIRQATQEAEAMGKENDDSYVEKIFQSMIGFNESGKLKRYKPIEETMISTSFTVTPEAHTVSDEERKKAEKLKKQLGVKV